MKSETIKLYNYVHCPYCIRVRMACGFLKQKYESIVLSYDDEKTPVQFCGKKMLPIVFSDGKYINESLDIVAHIDPTDSMSIRKFSSGEISDLEKKLTIYGEDIHSLCMPYWIFTPEFNPASRSYYQLKKEKKRGPFKNLITQRIAFEAKIMASINTLLDSLTPFYKSDRISILDIMIAAHFWGLYVVPEFRFPEKFHSYLQQIKIQTKFNYWENFEQYL